MGVVSINELSGNNLKSLKVTINDVELENVRIKSLDLYWDIDNHWVEGSLVYADNMNIVNTIPVTTDSIVKVFVQESDGSELHTYKFNIIDLIQTGAEDNQSGFILSMIDSPGYEMMSFYPILGLSNAKISDLLNNENTLLGISKKHGINKLEISDITTEYESYIFSTSKPLMNSLNNLKRTSNAYVYRKRNSYKICPLKELFEADAVDFEGKGKQIYKSNTDNFNYKFRIFDNQILPGSAMKGKYALADYKIHTFDIMNKTNKPFDLTYDDMLKYSQKDPKNIQTYSTTNYKTYYKPFQNYQAEMTYFYEFNARNLMEMNIVCPGSIKLNPGDSIQVETKGNNEDPYNKSTSGKWLVKSIKETITQTTFVHELNLIRSTPIEVPAETLKKS